MCALTHVRTLPRWPMMAWRRDPPAARLIQALPIVTGRAAPHPRQHADNPGHQTTPHRLCRPPVKGAGMSRARAASTSLNPRDRHLTREHVPLADVLAG